MFALSFLKNSMEIYHLEKDINLFCVTATSFPEGVQAAHRELHSLLPSTEGRNFFGISYPKGKGEILYRAAVEELYSGEGEKSGCELFTIKRGDYLSETLSD